MNTLFSILIPMCGLIFILCVLEYVSGRRVIRAMRKFNDAAIKKMKDEQ
jgi:hypothetical protein